MGEKRMQGMKCMSCGMHCKKVHLRSQFECGELGIRQSAIDRMKKKENALSNNSTPSQSVGNVDPEGSYNKDNTDEVNQLSRYEYFFNRYFEFYNAKSKNELVYCIASCEAMKAVRGGSQ